MKDARILVLVCSALLALAVGFEVYSSEYPPAALVELIQSRPLLLKLAWAVIIVSPFALLAAALWESGRLDQQRKANEICPEQSPWHIRGHHGHQEFGARQVQRTEDC